MILNHFGTDINVLELLSIMVALKLWGSALRGSCFVFQCDNNNSVLTLNSGRYRSLGMQLCLREIWFLSAFYDFEMTADYVPGRQFQLLTSEISTTHVACPPHYFYFEIAF